jgi:hypothetical protein
MSDELEVALRELGARIDVPETPDVVAQVRGRIAQKPKRHVLRPILVGLAAILVAGSVAFAVSPEVRAAVAEFFRFAGIEFRQDSPPPIPVTPFMPGERTISLDEAKERYGAQVPGDLRDPSEVRMVEDRVVSLLYPNMRLDEFDGEFGPAMAKFLPSPDIERIQVNGTDALWVPSPHEVLYIDRAGNWAHESARMSGKTLIWQQGSKTMRLEGEFTKEEAIEIASS